MCLIDWDIMSCGLNKQIENGIILYGASGSGQKMITFLDKLELSNKILAVVDSDCKKWGTIWMQYEIFSPEVLNSISNKAIVVITSVYLSEIYQFLQNKIKCSQKICSIFSFQYAIHYDILTNVPSYIDNQIVEKYKIQYELWRKNQIQIKFSIRYKAFFDMIKCIIENPKSILLCGIHKTGNMSLNASFEKSKKLNTVTFTRHASYCDKFTYKSIKDVLQSIDNHEIKIISGVREPIERIISQKWQRIDLPDDCDVDLNIPILIDKHYENFITDKVSHQKLEKELKGIKFDYNNGGNSYYSDIAKWFQDHIEKTFNVNIFDYPFDKEKGYSIIKSSNISIFIYRLDKLSKLEKEIGEFVDDTSFTLQKTNIASEKKCVFAYNEYLKNVKIKESFFNDLTSSKGMTHFYTEDECTKYRNKWKERLIP